MKKIFFCLFLLLSFFAAIAQPKKVLLEEITGAHCGNCPSGAWIVDSLTREYPNLIGVAIHSYAAQDAMYFSGLASIDSLINLQGGAPFGDIDRMQYSASVPLYMLFNFINTFDSLVQVRLAVPPSLTVSINPSWNSSTRNITAQVDVNILSNIVSGDYRISMYVVEDSVTGSSSGYDQSNYYDASPPGNPFFGMGNPIAGYVHRHVVRATLPVPLGQAGIISTTPTTGQNFITTFNYTLPASVNENKTSLVAFVYRYSSAGTNYEVLNAEDVSLTSQTTGVNNALEKASAFSVFPNPATTELIIDNGQLKINHVVIYDVLGQKRLAVNPAEASGRFSTPINVSGLSAGVYFIRVFTTEHGAYNRKIIVVK